MAGVAVMVVIVLMAFAGALAYDKWEKARKSRKQLQRLGIYGHRNK